MKTATPAVPRDHCSKRKRNLTRKQWIKTVLPRKRRNLIRRVHTDSGSQTSNNQSSKPNSLSVDPNTSSNNLRQILRLLNLLWQRNRNQHRRSKWWKWLSLLKRRLEKLLDLENVLNNPSATSTSSSAKPGLRGPPKPTDNIISAKTYQARFRLQEETRHQKAELERWIRDILIPNAYSSVSSSVVQDTQFAGLGLVVLSMLAEIARRFVGYPYAEATEKKERVGTRVGGEVRGDSGGHATMDDLGEVVQREVVPALGGVKGKEDGRVKANAIPDAETDESRQEEIQGDGVLRLPTEKTRGQSQNQEKQHNKEGKKSRKNVIDDMFAGFT